MTTEQWGEVPELPPGVIKELRTKMASARHSAADHAWSALGDLAVGMFEGYQARGPQR